MLYPPEFGRKCGWGLSGSAVLVELSSLSFELCLLSGSGTYSPLNSSVATEWVFASSLHPVCVLRGGRLTQGLPLDGETKSRAASFTSDLKVTC